MITEDYISFETAKLLKEKGFDIPLNYYYNSDGRKGYATTYNWNRTTGDFPDYSCPTLQMAMKWLREEHKIVIMIQPLSFNGAKNFLCDNWVYNVWLDFNLKIGESLKNQNTYSTYEQACEAAIKYCLENLI